MLLNKRNPWRGK